MHEEIHLEVTWIHHWKKNGKSKTLTRPFRVRDVQGLSGLALLNVDPGDTDEPKLASTKPLTNTNKKEISKR